MYLLSELILLSPLILYALLRVGAQVRTPILRNLLLAFIVLVALGYPVAEWLSHGSAPAWATYPMIAGYCSLPFLLYLVLTVIVSDLAIGIMRLLRIVSKETVCHRRFRMVRLCALLMVPAAVVVAGAARNNRLKVNEYSIEIPRKSSPLRQLRIVFASDFHLGRMTSGHLMERFAARVNSLNPEIVLIGGDVLEADRDDESLDGVEAQFRLLRSKYGVYGVPGNHEMHRGNRNDFFARSGIRLLQDAVEKIDGAFYLAGRKDGRSNNRKSIDDLLRDAKDDLPVILLDHRPTDLDRASQSRVDIQLSGHTHNGQLFPLNLLYHRLYEVSWGYLKKRDTHFIVSSGVQVWGPPVRTTADAEIVLVHVEFRENGGIPLQ
jgi:hypothetical protein